MIKEIMHSGRRTVVLAMFIMVMAHAHTFAEIRVYFNRSIDPSFALPGNVALGNVNFPAKLIQRIDSATVSIDLAVYSFSIDSVAHRLVAARNRGVKVRVVYANRSDQSAITILRSNGIPVMKRKDTNGLMHNKFFLFDARDSANAGPWVWTGSWNVTAEEQTNDFNNVVLTRHRPLSLAYLIEFEEMWGSAGDLPDSVNARFGSQKTDNTPHSFIINGIPVELYFSPTDGTTSQIISRINGSVSTVDFSLFAFTRQDIVQALKSRATGAGVAVTGIMEQIHVPATWDSLITFAHMFRHTLSGNLHHKYAIIDPGIAGARVITGSHNWSANAENINDENTLIIHDGLIANQFVQEFQKRRSELVSQLGGVVFNDVNGSGTKDPGEPGLGGWTINISGPVVASAVSDILGNYTFSGLPFGQYTLSQVLQSGWTQTLPPSNGAYEVFINAPTTTMTFHFGNQSGSTAIVSATSGNWNSPSTWSGGVVPDASNTVVVASGHTVTVNGDVSCSAITVGGTLQFDGVADRTLTCLGNFTIASAGEVRASENFVSGAVTNVITMGGSFTNNGAFVPRMTGSSSGTRVINVVFTGDGPTSIYGSTNPTIFHRLTLNKSSQAQTMTPLIDIGFGPSPGAGAFGLTRGTWVQNTGQTSVPSLNVTIAVEARLVVSGSGTFTTGAGSLIVQGALEVSGGSLLIGNGNNRLEIASSGAANFQGGLVFVKGRLTLSGGTTVISGGDVQIDPRGGSNLAASSNVFEVGAPANFTMTDGSITIINPRVASGTGREIRVVSGVGSKVFAGGTIYIGDGVSTLAGSDTGFVIESPLPLGDMVIRTGLTPGRSVSLAAPLQVSSLELKTGTLRLWGPFGNGFDLTVAGDLSRLEGILDAGSRSVSMGAPPSPKATQIAGAFVGVSALHGLVISNPAGVYLTDDLHVSGILEISSGLFNTGTHGVILGSSATLAEPAGRPVVGRIMTTRNVAQSINEDFGGIGLELLPSGASPGVTTAIRYTDAPATGGGNQSIRRVFDISSAVNSGLNARMRFYYDTSELNGQNPVTLALWKSVDGGTTWSQIGGIVDTALRRIEVENLNSLSRWTASDSAHPLSASSVLIPVSVQEGWNLVSNPLLVVNDSLLRLYPSSVFPYGYAFLSPVGYVQRYRLDNGVGYWAKFPSNETVILEGTSLTLDTVDVHPGWNIVGSISVPTDTASIFTIPPGIRVSQFFSYSGGYTAVGELQPGGGYWVKMSAAGKLVFVPSAHRKSIPERFPN